MIRDMTVGKPSKTLLTYSIPMLISAAFQQLYNIADGVIAGKFDGEAALAAVGASYPITMIFMAIALGANIGCSVVVSRLFGAKKLDEMKSAISTTFIACLVLCAALTAFGLAACTGLMRLIQTPADIFEDSALYLRVYVLGLTFLFFYNVCNGIFSALGDSRTPLYFLIASSLGNIYLDWLFVARFHMGVGGVAWATFIAQGISCILALLTLFLRLRRIPAPPHRAFSWPLLRHIVHIAVPSILQQSFISIGNLFVQGMVNACGSTVLAAYSAAIKLNTFAITSFTTLSNGMSNYTSQNLGAQKTERVTAGCSTAMKMGCAVAAVFAGFYFFFGDIAMRLFLNGESAEAISIGFTFLRIITPFYFIVSCKLMADGVLRGAGAMRCFMISTFSDLLLRVAIAFVLSSPLGMAELGIWLSWPIGWIAAGIISIGYYRKGVWRPETQSAKA